MTQKPEQTVQDGKGWDVRYPAPSGDLEVVRTEHLLTYEGGRMVQEKIVRDKNPRWTSLTRTPR